MNKQELLKDPAVQELIQDYIDWTMKTTGKSLTVARFVAEQGKEPDSRMWEIEAWSGAGVRNIWWKVEGGFQQKEGGNIWSPSQFENVPSHKIHAIRLKETGEVFRVGDKVHHKDNSQVEPYVIDRFEVRGDSVLIKEEDGTYLRDEEVAHYVPKEPVLVTKIDEIINMLNELKTSK